VPIEENRNQENRETSVSAPRTFEDLTAQIARQHDDLPSRLQIIASFAVQHPNEMALSTVSQLAKRMGVQPSAIVRFANSFGYDGFTNMQQVYRARLTAGASPSYRDRINALKSANSGARSNKPADILASFISDDVASLESLFQNVPSDRMERAVSILAGAENIYVAGLGRSFPISYYIDYGLNRLDLKSHLLDGIGGFMRHRVRAATKNDVLVAISFKDYSPDVVEVATELARRDVPVIVITDNPLGPFAKVAKVSFEIGELRAKPFRSLVAPICLAQSLVVSLGHKLTSRNGARNGS
jgi:DNA-binding MurR/RpiR family transcriptional regulator